MPKLTGTELLTKMRILNQHLPAIICTGYSEVIDQGELKQLALNAVLMKPFTLAKITRAVKAVLTA